MLFCRPTKNVKTRRDITEINADLNIERYSRFESSDISAEHLQVYAVLVDVSDGCRRQSFEVVIIGHGSNEEQLFTGRLAPHISNFIHGERETFKCSHLKATQYSCNTAIIPEQYNTKIR